MGGRPLKIYTKLLFFLKKTKKLQVFWMQTTQNLYEIWFFYQKHKFRIVFELWTIKNQLVFLVFLAKTQISYRFWRIDPPRTWNTLKFRLGKWGNAIYIYMQKPIFVLIENQQKLKSAALHFFLLILIKILLPLAIFFVLESYWFSGNSASLKILFFAIYI